MNDDDVDELTSVKSLQKDELPEHAAQGPVTASKRPTPSLSQDSARARKQPRRWVV